MIRSSFFADSDLILPDLFDVSLDLVLYCLDRTFRSAFFSFGFVYSLDSRDLIIVA